MDNDSSPSMEEQIKLIEKEIAYIKSLIYKTNAKIKKLKNNFYLTYDDLIQNDITKNKLFIVLNQILNYILLIMIVKKLFI